MSTFVWLMLREEGSDKGEKTGKDRPPRPDDGRVRHELWTSGPEGGFGDTPGHVLAYMERELGPEGPGPYREARKRGARSFLLWADPYRRQPWARVVTTSAGKGKPSVYEVHGPAGEPLAQIIRERALNGSAGRTRWTVRQQGRSDAVGRKGRLFWWWVWWLFSPVQLAIAVGSLIGGGGDIARMPRRIRFRSSGEYVLDHPSDGPLEVVSGTWDPRVTAGLLALLDSHDGIFGSAWDDYKD